MRILICWRMHTLLQGTLTVVPEEQTGPNTTSTSWLRSICSVENVPFLGAQWSSTMCVTLRRKINTRQHCKWRQRGVQWRIYHWDDWATWAMPPPLNCEKNLAYGKQCNQNAPFSGKNLKNFLPDPTPAGEGNTPDQTPHPRRRSPWPLQIFSQCLSLR